MEEDKITDFERAEIFKVRLKSQYSFIKIIGILMFILGFMVAKAFYLFQNIQN